MLLNSSKRPKGVLIKYKELYNAASKDAATLDKLENQYIITQLEKARVEDPWELITKPMLKKYPVAPKRKQIGILVF